MANVGISGNRGWTSWTRYFGSSGSKGSWLHQNAIIMIRCYKNITQRSYTCSYFV